MPALAFVVGLGIGIALTIVLANRAYQEGYTNGFDEAHGNLMDLRRQKVEADVTEGWRNGRL